MRQKKNSYTAQDLASPEKRDAIAREHEYLMLRIVNQWDGRCPLDRSLIEMQARYGLVYAMNHYREGTSQSFSQYAAWCMKNWILNGINEFGSVVRLNSGQRDKLRKAGLTTCNTVSIDRTDTPDGDYEINQRIQDTSYEISCEVTDHDTVFKRLVNFVKKNFDKRTRDIFFSTYHLNGCKLMKGSELAKKYGVSTALISQSNHSVIDRIRQNSTLCELLDSFRA